MKKLSLVAIAAVLATPAFADPIGANVGINTSVSQGVNVGSVTNLGLNNVGVVNQNVAVGGGINLATAAFNQGGADFNMDTHAFSVGSIVDSGNGGDGGDVNVVAINAAVALSETDTTRAVLPAASRSRSLSRPRARRCRTRTAPIPSFRLTLASASATTPPRRPRTHHGAGQSLVAAVRPRSPAPPRTASAMASTPMAATARPS